MPSELDSRPPGTSREWMLCSRRTCRPRYSEAHRQHGFGSWYRPSIALGLTVGVPEQFQRGEQRLDLPRHHGVRHQGREASIGRGHEVPRIQHYDAVHTAVDREKVARRPRQQGADRGRRHIVPDETGARSTGCPIRFSSSTGSQPSICRVIRYQALHLSSALQSLAVAGQCSGSVTPRLVQSCVGWFCMKLLRSATHDACI